MNKNNDETDETRTNEEGVEASSNEEVDDFIKLIQEVTEVVVLYRDQLQKQAEDMNDFRNSVWSHNCQADEWDCGCDDVTDELMISDNDDCQFDDSFEEEMV